MIDMITFLNNEGVLKNLLHEVQEYTAAHPVEGELCNRIPVPHFMYYGTKVWNESIAALLCGKNILLAGEKATGKNVLAENLCTLFQRPSWDISFHVHMDASSLIGSDSFEDGKVIFRKGPVYQCAQSGGFGILDEINMAKNEALAVLHSILDFRRVMDVPGYLRVELQPETRFIATMNYNYAGTRELNEALASRFVVIQMPLITEENLERLLKDNFTDLTKTYTKQFALLFMDLQKKCESAELSTKALDLRGLLDAIALMQKGIGVNDALDLGITNKTMDAYEQELIHDVMHSRISSKVHPYEVFQ